MNGIKHITGINNISPEILFDHIIPRCVEMIPQARERDCSLRHPNRKAIIFAGENSTRTAGSYVEAARRLGWHCERESNTCSSLNKRESWWHTVRTWANYHADVIALRSSTEGLPLWLAQQCDAHGLETSIQNMGDGTQGHPSQTVLDLVTIQEKLGCLDNLTIGLVGDLRQSRVAKSILLALSRRTNISVVCISPTGFRLPEKFKSLFKNFTETEDMEALNQCDAIVMLRWQAERFKHPADELDLVRLALKFQLNKKTMRYVKKDAIILHPLPIDALVQEIHHEVENDPRIVMWHQEWYGIPVRMCFLEMGYENRLDMSAHLPSKRPEIKTVRETSLKAALLAQRYKNPDHFIPITEKGCVVDHLEHGTATVLQSMLIRTGVVKPHGINTVTGAFLEPREKPQKDQLILRGQLLSEEAMIKIAGLAPSATFNTISGDRFHKQKVIQEDCIVVGIGKCDNEACITNKQEPGVVSRFINLNHGSGLFACCYCSTDHSIHELIGK